MKKNKKTGLLLLLSLTGLIIVWISLHLGRFPVAMGEVFQAIQSVIFQSNFPNGQIHIILFKLRLPRILAAFLVGGTLSLTGAAYQGMFRNPMVSPSILGVSAGAGFGASLAILLGLSAVFVQFMSFVFGIGAVLIVYFISLSVGKRFDVYLTLILSGMVVGALFTAFVSLLKYVADPNDTLPSIVYWLMGGFASIELSQLKYITVIALAGLVYLTISGWKLDLLSFGDDEAKTMGLPVNRIRIVVILIATLMTSATVSISGIIGWVGLLVPHISRMVIGPKNNYLLPASFLIGGIFLILVDDFSRTITSMEIPLGITTAIIGAPFFIFILLKTSKKQSV
jgi:iron complex transport system permease protein